MNDHASGPARAAAADLPVHFFTIVLNGEPFIRYHESVFAALPFRWHWHVVEGVADLVHDTAWSLASGGRIPAGIHDRGRSNDGTSAYLDDLARRFPDRVTLYRKPLDVFWDGKKEMVSAPLPSITEACLLWQVDNDEFWTTDQIVAVRNKFLAEPERTAAWYWCWYYVGPEKIVSTRYNYAEKPNQEWLRTWRFTPGCTWEAHEPPMLVRHEGSSSPARTVDIAWERPFSQDEMEEAGAAFHHLAYITPAQLAFKEDYYGYTGATARWEALNRHQGSGFLKDYFSWVSDETMFDDASVYGLEPMARWDEEDERWRFDGRGLLPTSEARRSRRAPRIVVDGVFWQHLSSGIGRVWENLIAEWVASGFARHVVVLDRAGTAPRIAGAHYWTIARHGYGQTGEDSELLEATCRRLGADLFVSTYYSTPLDTPSFFSGYDMIPEMLGLGLEDEAWQEKRRAILHASAHGMISESSARDLEALYPRVPKGSTRIAHAAAASRFAPPPPGAIEAFRTAHGLAGKPYCIMIGERAGFQGYKNGELAFRALALIPAERRPMLVCVGGQERIETDLLSLAPGLKAKRLALGDADLVACYGGAHALLYPSRYEGFGMPPLEAMACGTPAIVCRTSSLPEVVGDAGLYVDESDAAGMAEAILSLYDPARRAELIARGKSQAATFSFSRMAAELAAALTETAERLEAGSLPRPGPAWAEMRAMQRSLQEAGLAVGAPDRRAGSQSRRAAASLDLAQAIDTIAAMKKSPFWKLRGAVIGLLRRGGARGR